MTKAWNSCQFFDIFNIVISAKKVNKCQECLPDPPQYSDRNDNWEKFVFFIEVSPSNEKIDIWCDVSKHTHLQPTIIVSTPLIGNLPGKSCDQNWNYPCVKIIYKLLT